MRPSLGLVGRIFLILLLAITIEFTVSTFLHERAGQLRVEEDEAHRVAEHLAAASRLLNASPRSERPELAARLSSETFIVEWHPTSLPLMPMAAPLDEMRTQIIGWEPTLGPENLRLHLKEPGRNGKVAGQLSLADGSSLEFRATQLVDPSRLRINRFLLALVPAMHLSSSADC